MVTTRLEERLARIREDPQGARDFLICDAKDGDMGGGIPMPGPRRDGEGRPSSAFKTRRDYLDQVTALVRQDILDMVLLSIGNLERLVAEGVFRDSRVGTAIRANVGSDKLSRAEIGAFVNDNIVRVIAAVPQACRPQFLKIAYNGPKALEELVTYDPTIIVGILGGGAGTTRDTFELLAAAQRGGARLVLFGRKINLAEDPLALVALMKRLVG